MYYSKWSSIGTYSFIICKWSFFSSLKKILPENWSQTDQNPLTSRKKLHIWLRNTFIIGNGQIGKEFLIVKVRKDNPAANSSNQPLGIMVFIIKPRIENIKNKPRWLDRKVLIVHPYESRIFLLKVNDLNKLPYVMDGVWKHSDHFDFSHLRFNHDILRLVWRLEDTIVLSYLCSKYSFPTLIPFLLHILYIYLST